MTSALAPCTPLAITTAVIPAQAGTQITARASITLGPSFRRDDIEEARN